MPDTTLQVQKIFLVTFHNDRITNKYSNKMGNSLLAVRDINHKYIVVERK